MTDTLRDVDLLRIEIGVIWTLDDHGRLPGPEDVVIGVAADGMIGAVGRNVPEAGTWTSPAFRGRGYAATATAAWADLFSGTRLFYSTSADNHSSQRVAARLGLRNIGWLWKLTR
ncbi:GNAT family N-acetyltransferase [Nonomuraea sp. M3C6]|uniref:GNAT family N-acetyltransferase n=1 Tax=Nonomuraea marmarensis TaxID=3351344 RepID=A0ABW7A391_9ACTN